MKKTILFSFMLVSVSIFAQDNHSRIKSELVEWDPVRGEWLAESFNAMANNKPIPDRTFPEDLTPAEMYSLVPSDRQNRIREIAGQPAATNNRVPESQQGTNRVPVGNTSNNNRTPNNTNDRYNYFVSRPGCGNLTMGRSYGDPHIRTFDGKSYSFQTVGEYILSGSPDRSFEVQARQRPQTNDVSLNTAVAMNVYGDRVGIYASDLPDGISGTPVRVNGRPIYLNNETFYLPYGGTIQHTGREYVVTWPTGEKVQAKISTTGGMRFMNLSVFVYSCNGNYFGLMGNANGRSDDDFSGGRNDLASSSIFTPFGSREFGSNTSTMEREHLAFLARDFGNQFLVNDQTSLFDYSFGQSSWTFYDPSFPRTFLTMGDISQADRDRARRECERQGILADDMSGCVMDLAHANIQPTPRPTTSDRTTGREVTPVTERKPNVNRPDVFDRESVPVEKPTRDNRNRDNGGKVVIGGTQTAKEEREPTTTPGNRPQPIVIGDKEAAPERESKTGGTTARPSGTTTQERKPVDLNQPVGKPTGDVQRPATTTERPATNDTKKPTQPEERPVVRPTTETKKPSQSERPVTPPAEKPVRTTSSSQEQPSKTQSTSPSASPSRGSSGSTSTGTSRSGTSTGTSTSGSKSNSSSPSRSGGR